MRLRLLACAALGLLLAACGATPPKSGPPGEGEAAIGVSTSAKAPGQPPDAVFEVRAGQALKTADDSQLKAIAAQMKRKKRLLIRLEAAAPDKGSLEVALGRAAAASAKISRRLAALGVPAYRINEAPRVEAQRQTDTPAPAEVIPVSVYLIELPR